MKKWIFLRKNKKKRIMKIKKIKKEEKTISKNEKINQKTKSKTKTKKEKGDSKPSSFVSGGVAVFLFPLGGVVFFPLLWWNKDKRERKRKRENRGFGVPPGTAPKKRLFQSVFVVVEWDNRRFANVTGESQECRDWGGVRRDQDFSGRKQFGRRAWQSMLRRWC